VTEASAEGYICRELLWAWRDILGAPTRDRRTGEMAEPLHIYTEQQLVALWQQLSEAAKARTRIVRHIGSVIDHIGHVILTVRRISARVEALERQAGLATDALAQTTNEVRLIENGLNELAGELQRTKDVINLEGIEKDLAAQGIAPRPADGQ